MARREKERERKIRSVENGRTRSARAGKLLRTNVIGFDLVESRAILLFFGWMGYKCE